MTSEADLLAVTTIIECLMDYSRQLIMDEQTDGQDYGSAAVIDGITFMKDFQAKQAALAARVEALERQNAALVKAAEGARDALLWCGGSNDFQPEGIARKGWESVVVPAYEYLKTALNGGEK